MGSTRFTARSSAQPSATGPAPTQTVVELADQRHTEYIKRIDEVLIDNAGNPRWAEQCWNRLRHAYARADGRHREVTGNRVGELIEEGNGNGY